MNLVRVMNPVRQILLCSVLLALAAGSLRAQGTSEYTDDFTTDKAQYDCYVSSTFWPSDIDDPPSCSYLSYLGTGEARGLAFMDYRGDMAQLEYGFLLDPVAPGVIIGGTLQVDVSFPCNAEISQFPPGRLLWSASADGQVWSVPQLLAAGRRGIPLLSATGVWYVRLIGVRVVIDNLRVSLSTTGATIRLPKLLAARQADNEASHLILHVDGRSGDDGNSGRSRSSAFATIQAAIDEAQNGDTVVVWPGVYEEEVRFKNKAITVQSAADAAVITAPSGYACSFYDAEGAQSVLSNFVIAGCGVAGIFCDGASPTLRNLTIAGNQAGIAVYGGANPNVVNCIIWNNINGPLSAWKANFNWRISYSCIDLPNPNRAKGNINADPQFADPLNGDYHLKSPWGRYVPWTNTWVHDPATSQSPCIDAGDPTDGPRAERTPNGGRINMGAYGGTPFASHSSGPPCP